MTNTSKKRAPAPEVAEEYKGQVTIDVVPFTSPTTGEPLRAEGVWTPNADVLCLKCHGPSFNRGYAVHTIPEAQFCTEANALRARDAERDEDGTRCSRCSAFIWVRSDVAMLYNLGLAVGDATWEDDRWGFWEMQQTGGMMAALAISLPDPDLIAVATMVDGPLYVGILTRAEWSGEDGDGVPHEGRDVASIAEAIAYLREVVSR